MTIYRLFYEARDKSASGEALPVLKEKEAARICKEHNKLFPRYRHTYEPVEVDDAHAHLLTNPQ